MTHLDVAEGIDEDLDVVQEDSEPDSASTEALLRAEREAAIFSSAEFKTKAADILKVINALPQVALLSREDCRTWIANTYKLSVARPGEDPIWHARRLRGIGSSEIGACVSSARGEFTPFQSARDIVLSKLMKKAPDGGTEDTERGKIMEPIIQQLFHARYKTQSEKSMMKDMANFSVDGAPWMVGNPDDICFINGKLYMIDYKAPTPAILAELKRKGEVKFDYVCQLHHLERIAKSGGLKIEGRLLCSFDYLTGGLDVRSVEYDPALMDEMMEVGDNYWFNYVMQGLVPDRVIQPTYDAISKDELAVIDGLLTRFTIARQMGKRILDLSYEIEAEIFDRTRAYQLEGAKIETPFAKITASQMLDTDELESVSLAYGFDMPDANDDEALVTLMEALDEKGVDRTRYLYEKHKIAISRKKKGDVAEALQAFTTDAVSMYEDYAENFLVKPDSKTVSLPKSGV